MASSISSTCDTRSHFARRTLLKASVGSVPWLTPLATTLARAAESSGDGNQARSVIVLWLAGGPSQLETFDPHPDPGSNIAGGTKRIKTPLDDVYLAAGMDQTSEQMADIALVRSVISKEGDHERATYNAKTGFRPDPTLVHPSIGAIVCHQLHDSLDIPRHVSIFPGPWPARGGYLGDQFDAFKMYDPKGRIPDLTARVPERRAGKRVDDLLNVIEPSFAKGRIVEHEPSRTLHRSSIEAAIRMMSSDQINAFDVNQAPASLRAEYGDTPFGRGCLAAARLIEAGVRCVEITLRGWDTHANNHESQGRLVQTLDPAFAALIRDLKRRALLGRTVVLCGGEFGRTPRINTAGGRDHWPHGFTIALAGGGIQGGRVVGEVSPDPELRDKSKFVENVSDPQPIENIHATTLHALGIRFERELMTPVGRPMAISKGKVIPELLAS